MVFEEGDTSKPYRHVPMFDAKVAPLIRPGEMIDTVNLYRLPERPLEQLPTSRKRFALAAQIAHRFNASTLRVSERLYADTWNLKATTTDLRYLIDVAKDVRVWPHLRFHAQTGGSTLTAQQPEVNLIRVALQAFSATAGGAQSLHTNGFDEALALPTEHAATLALRTQQVLAHESGITATADPFGGSWYIEGLTDELEARALELIDEIDKLGGSVVATEQGFIQDQIEDSAYRSLRRLENGDDIVVGVNKYRNEEEPEVPIHRIDASLEQQQVARTQALRASRDAGAVESALTAVRAAADSDTNLLHPMKDALAAGSTVGEVCGVLREAWGTHDR
jgi:methylmalonyl-CoA mutase N-terminal domain/subunit